MTRPLVLAVALAASACNCGDTKLQNVPDACAVGSVTGRACAPDQHTWISGATVDVRGTDCHGDPFDASGVTGADGTFSIANVPAGKRTVEVRSGVFSNDYDVQIAPNTTTHLPDNQLCFQQNAARVAVVTAKGDHIETLLGDMGLAIGFKVDGGSGWSSNAKPFLMNRTKLAQYDVLFLDCGAAESQGSIALGSSSDSQQIADNLREFVQQGGSVYASDWAFLFLALAWPDQVQVLDPSGSPRSPFPTKELMGYAPQTITARVSDSGLAAYLHKDSVTVAFPAQSGAVSRHWGLLEDASNGATALLEGNATTCAGDSRDPMDCMSKGSQATNVPLAVTFQPAGAKGRVTYTSFHNIAQPTGDVEAILRYLVFHL